MLDRTYIIYLAKQITGMFLNSTCQLVDAAKPVARCVALVIHHITHLYALYFAAVVEEIIFHGQLKCSSYYSQHAEHYGQLPAHQWLPTWDA